MTNLMQNLEIDRLRKVYLYMLDAFSAICKSNNIKWYLYAGSLLGAVRHGGFIPWDDDVDICVFEDDMDDIMRNMPEGFSLTKFRNEHYVFSLDNTLMINTVDRDWFRRLDNGGPSGIHIDVFPIYNTNKKAESCDDIITLGYGHFKIPLSYFGEPRIVKFEDRMYPIPSNSDGLLKIVYGDYKKCVKYLNRHKQFIDFENGQRVYMSGILKIPSGNKFIEDFPGIMFSRNKKIEKTNQTPHRGVIRNLHSRGNGKQCLNDLIASTGLKNIKLIEVGAYAGEGTKIFAENDKVDKIVAVQLYRPWFDNRSLTANSNLEAAKEEMVELKEKYNSKIKLFEGTLNDLISNGLDFKPDIIYIDEQFRLIEDVITQAFDTGVRYIAGHDYSNSWSEIKNAVDCMLGGPDLVFEDTSWIKDVSNLRIKERIKNAS